MLMLRNTPNYGNKSEVMGMWEYAEKKKKDGMWETHFSSLNLQE